MIDEQYLKVDPKTFKDDMCIMLNGQIHTKPIWISKQKNESGGYTILYKKPSTTK